MLRLWLALCLSLAAAPAAAQPGGVPVLVDGADARIWDGAAASGAIIHRRSGVAFPERYGEFRRFRVAAVGADGSDVILGYRRDRAGRETVVTVYLFQPGPLPEHRLGASIAAIGIRSPQAFLWANGPFLTGSSPDLRAHKAVFKTGIGPNTVMDYLYFAPMGRWTVKVRATIDSPTSVDNEREVDALVRALPWDTILSANGPCEAVACTLTGAYPIDSHHLEMLLPGREDAASVYRQGDYRLAAAWPDALLEYFSETFGRLSVQSPLYSLETRRDGRWRIVRLFTGLPSEAEFRAHVAGLSRRPEGSEFIPASQVVEYLPEALR